MIEMKKYIRIFSALFLITQFLILQGCSRGADIAAIEKNTNNFIEKTHGLPSEIVEVLDCRVVDNKIEILALVDEMVNPKIYSLKVGDNSWVEEEFKCSYFETNDNLGIRQCKFFYDDKIIIEYIDNSLEASKLAIIDKTDDMMEFNICENTIDKIITDNEKILLVYNDFQDVIVFNYLDNKVENEYIIELDEIKDICISNDKLIVYNDSELVKVDKVSGEMSELISFSDSMEECNFSFWTSATDDIYGYNLEGIYQLDFKEDKVEIINEYIKFNESKSLQIVKIVGIDEKSFFVLLYDIDNSQYIIKEIVGKSDGNIEVDEKIEISIYSLYDNEIIRKAIESFKRENDNINIIYEIGIEDFSLGKNASDAMRTLNTELLANKGPDIIILDDLPEKDFIEKGILTDISDISEFLLKDEEVFSNIIKAAEHKDGNTYSIPLRYSIPVIIGEISPTTNTLKALAEDIADIDSDNEKEVLRVYEIEQLIWLLYRSCGEQWINSQGKVDSYNITEFLEYISVINDSLSNFMCEDKYELIMEEKIASGGTVAGESYASIKYYDGTELEEILYEEGPLVALSNINDIYNIAKIESISKNISKVNYNIWKGNGDSFVIPVCSVGINSNSKEVDLAKQFIKSAFSKEYQNRAKDYGIPLRKDILRERLQSEEIISDESSVNLQGERYELLVEKLEEKDIDIFIEKLENINNISKIDKEVLNKIIDDIVVHVNEEKSIEEIISKIEKNLEIYLAE